MAAALTNLAKKNMPFIWSEFCQKAFDEVKHALTHAPVLALPDCTLTFVAV